MLLLLSALVHVYSDNVTLQERRENCRGVLKRREPDSRKAHCCLGLKGIVVFPPSFYFGTGHVVE